MKKLLSHFTKIVAIWIIGFLTFFGTLPNTPEELPDPVDAIVVLTGDNNRISTGFELYKHFRGEKLFISGVYPGTTVADLTRPYLPAHRTVGIELDDKARNTHENAVETAKWLKLNNYRSIILVTSDYHMRRSWIHFQNQIPDIVITPYAVKPDTPWFQSYKGIKTMVRAYNKLIVTFPIIALNNLKS